MSAKSWSLGAVLSLTVAHAAYAGAGDPISFEQTAIGPDVVRIDVVVGDLVALGELASMADFELASDPGKVLSSVEGAALTFEYGGGFATSPLIDGSVHSVHSANNIDVLQDGVNSRFQVTFGLSDLAPLDSGRVLVSFEVQRPAAVPGTLSLFALGVTPVFGSFTVAEFAGNPAWASTEVAAMIPEPSAYLLFAVGLAGLAAARRFR